MHKIKSLSFLLYITILSSCVISLTNAQNNILIEGSWAGKLQIQSIELRIVVNVVKDSAGKLTATLDSPDQSAYDIPVDEVIFNEDSVKFIVKSVAGFYEGKYFADSIMIKGNWNQGGMSLPLVLRITAQIEKPNRPQEPKEPFPYQSEEVKFENKNANITLAGTLTLPEHRVSFPAVVLITGSGAQNRDEELLGHKPFLVLADYLTRNGIAVLRFDDRGVGESNGDFSSANSEDFAGDVLSAVEYLKSRSGINPKQIGLAGHSEGGIIASMVAVESEDVAFIVLMAGPGLPGDEILMLQTELINKANEMDEEELKENLKLSREIYDVILIEKDSIIADSTLRKLFEEHYNKMSDKEKEGIKDKETFLENKIKTLLSPWFTFFIRYDPYPMLTKVKCPVLAIIGEKDLQVPPKENLSAIEKALKEGGNQNFKTVELQGLNHLFQTAETGLPLEYGKIEETFSPDAMKIILDWIKGLNNR
ncbi:MAG: alpha/beta fold hydrolase [Bacteroidetes bacterium]|nr:alpha/beta fold hydrolase [Bacteroidota bacterium]